MFPIMTNTNITDGLKKGDLVRVVSGHHHYGNISFHTYRVVRRLRGDKVRIVPASLEDNTMLAKTADSDGRMVGNRACWYEMVGREYNASYR